MDISGNPPESGHIGIQNLIEVIQAGGAVSREVIKIKKEGIASATTDLLMLLPTLKAAAQEINSVPVEAKDIDPAEAEQLAAVIAAELRQTLIAAGVSPDSDFMKGLSKSQLIIPRVMEMAKQGKEIYEILHS